MQNGEKIFWELLNNEIRSVTKDDSGDLVIVTRFRSIQNELRFLNAEWSDKVDELKGENINFVEEVVPGSISAELTEYIKSRYSKSFVPESLKSAGKSLYKVVSAKSSHEGLVIADDMNILING